MARARTSAPSSSMREVVALPSVRLAAGVIFVIMLGYGLIVPVLPLFARSFGVGRAEVGMLVASFAVMRLVFDLVGGPLVDRFGERAIATAGATVVGVSSALSAVAPSFGLLLVFRSLGGAGSSVMFAAMMNHLVHTVSPDRMARAMTMYYGAFLMGTVLGQPLGGVIGEFLGLASPLWFYAGASFIAAGLIARFLGERAAGLPRGEGPPAVREDLLAEVEAPLPTAWGRIRGLLSGRAFVAALAANAVLFWTLGSVRITLVPLFAKEEIGLSATSIGAVLGVAAVAQFVVMWRAGSIADSRGRKVVILPSLLLLAAAVALIGWAGTAPFLVVAMVLVGVGTGFAGVAPAAVVADVAPRRSGMAIGMYRFAGDVGFVMGPLMGGIVAEAAGFTAAFTVLAVPAVLVFLLVLGMPETLRRPVAKA